MTPEHLVARLQGTGAITSDAVAAALRAVPRHRLLEAFAVMGPDGPREVAHDPEDPDPEHLALIYADQALVTRMDGGLPSSSTSQPSLVARMLGLLDLRPGMRVLEVGAGTGWNAALLAELVGDQRLVTSVDAAADVVAQTRRLLAAAGYAGLRVVCRDGAEGAPEHGLYDRIVATVACPDVPPAWIEQLAPGGWALVPLEHAGCHPLVRVVPAAGGLRGRVVGHSGFMAAGGSLAPLDWWRPVRRMPPGFRPDLPSDDVHTEPVWEGFGDGPPVWGGRCTADQLGFGMFVAVHDRRALWTGGEVGLTDGEAGWALAGADGIRWWGDRRLLDDLHRLHGEWAALGRPPVTAYRITLRSGDTTADGWVVPRRWGPQHTTLG